MTTCFLIPGSPKGKDRPKFNSEARRAYTTPATREYEETVRWSYISATQSNQRLHSGKIRVEIEANFAIPSSWRVAKKNQAKIGEIAPGKPDCDNIAKAVLDALNGIAYKDDSGISELLVKKRYGEKAYVAVRIESEGYDDAM